MIRPGLRRGTPTQISAPDPGGELHCACGYNVRSLPDAGRCPECGAPVELARRGRPLAKADRRWLARVAAGVDWVCYAGVALLLLNALLLSTQVRLPFDLLTFAVQIAGYFGVWLLVTPEPGTSDTRLTWLVRAAALVWLLLAAAGWGPAHSLLIGLLAAFVGAPMLVADVGCVVLAARLASRLPDVRLAQRLFAFAWFNALVFGALLLASVPHWVGYFLNRPAAVGPFSFDMLLTVSVAAMMLMLLLRTVLLFMVGRRLARVLDEPAT